MVWFQCEDCGDNLKKPKLPHHFSTCSAFRLSCIDCGEMFSRETVQGHTQCMTEMEKYGPKGQAKASGAKPKDAKQHQKPDFDITVGLSDRPPWFCSLCNTNATSRQTLMSHAEGKKHKGKARAIHAAKHKALQPEEPAPDTKPQSEETPKGTEEAAAQEAAVVETVDKSSEVENGKLTKKKRKLEEGKSDESRKKTKDTTSTEVSDEKAVIQNGKAEKETKLKKDNEDAETKIKWKKIITSTLKSKAGVLKMRKLKKLVLEAIAESGITEDAKSLGTTFEEKINSSSRFRVEDKYVHLVV